MIYLKISLIVSLVVLITRYFIVPIARHIFEMKYEQALKNNLSGKAGIWSKLYCKLPLASSI